MPDELARRALVSRPSARSTPTSLTRWLLRENLATLNPDELLVRTGGCCRVVELLDAG
jgi:hypothetical protein